MLPFNLFISLNEPYGKSKSTKPGSLLDIPIVNLNVLKYFEAKTLVFVSKIYIE